VFHVCAVFQLVITKQLYIETVNTVFHEQKLDDKMMRWVLQLLTWPYNVRS